MSTREARSKPDGFAVSMAVDSLRAAPGWVLLRRLAPVDDKSAGGILLIHNDEKNPSLISQGVVIDSGVYKDKRTGRMSFKAGWLPKGSIVQFIPHQEWTLGGVGSRDIIGCYSDDILTIPENASLVPVNEDLVDFGEDDTR